MPDIAEFSPDPPTEIIKVGGRDLPVRGISARALAGIYRRYPELATTMQGAGPEKTDHEIGLIVLDVTPALIAAAIRRPEDEQQIADDLAVSEATDAFSVIMRLTQGQAGPFVDGEPAPSPLDQQKPAPAIAASATR